jgi:hypothetical protein
MTDANPRTTLLDLPPPAPSGPSSEKIRQRLHGLLNTARAAARMPWEPRDAEVNEILFRQMANWLPPAEASDLHAAFAAELARLRAL